MNFLGRYKLYIGAWSLFILFVLLPPTNVYPKVLFQFWPTLSVSEEFSDNYLETRDNKQEEFITTYGAGFSLGMFEKNLRFYLNYSPEYRDYKELNDRDRLVHPIELGGEWSPTRRTDLAMGIAYTAGNDNYQSESEHNTASFSGIT
ncbi:MAG: hypothetical protein MI747_23370, partial [Desulfobacterales bacterium]|nr:hypothetical protein [Desulfobacterales bacterium]